ncbi:MAG: MtrB/PioB family outer membrane beta-barrel protein [Vicinamibacterales bacterium]
MKRATLPIVLLASGVLLFGAPGYAQQSSTEEQTDFETGEVSLAVQGRPDVDSSKFQEYRDVVKGVSMPEFRLFGRNKGLRFDLRGENVQQLNERYIGTFKTDWFGVSADYNSIVHRIGNDGRTFLSQQSLGEWRMSDTLQSAIQNAWETTPTSQRIFTTFVQPLFQPSLDAGTVVDVQVLRERTSVVADLARNQPFNIRLNYDREQRHGSGGLSSNYLSYVTETPQVTEYLTQDAGVSAALDKPWGNVRGALHYNWYRDQVKALLFDSPFRVSDALTATVGTGAAATSVGGPSYGRMINPPDNQATSGTFGTTLKLARNTRFTGDVSMSRMTQNDQLFPYITNTAVVTPFAGASTSTLPTQSLNGKIDSTGIVLALTSKPIEPLKLALRFRRYDLDNRTPRITFPGIGSWDRSVGSTARITVPYGYTSDRLDATIGYDLKLVTLEGGLRRTTIDRTYREVEQTAENTASIAAVMHFMDNAANLRASYEKGSRDYSGLELARSEDASLVVVPTGLSSNALAREGSLRFDSSKRSSDRAGIVFDISPMPMTTLAFTYLRNKDTYKETRYGLQDANYDTYTGEVSVSPGETWSVTGYYSREKNGSHQVNNGTSNFPAIDDFIIRLTDDVDTAGVTTLFTLVPAKAVLNLSGRHQNLEGKAGLTANAGSSYQLARASMGGVQDIPNADNAKITRLDASVDYTLASKVLLTIGTWYEDYKFSDVDSLGLQNIYPGSFFLALNDGSYHAAVGYVRLTYHW